MLTGFVKNIFSSLFEDTVVDLMKKGIVDFVFPKNLEVEKNKKFIEELLSELESLITQEDTPLGTHYIKEVAVICYKLSIAYEKTKNELSIDYSKKYIHESIKRIDLLDNEECIKIYLQAANLYEKTFDYKESINMYRLAKHYIEQHNYHDFSSLLFSLSKNYFYTCDYEHALKYIKKALKYNDNNLDYFELKALILCNSEDEKKILKAIKIQENVVSKRRTKNDIIKLTDGYINLAIIKLIYGEVDEAKILFRTARYQSNGLNEYIYKHKFTNIYYYLSILEDESKALEYAQKHIDLSDDITKYTKALLGNFSALLTTQALSFYASKINLESAYQLNKKAIIINERIYNDFNLRLEASYHYMSLICFSLNKYDEAITYEIKAIDINEISNNLFYLRHNYKNVAKYYNMNGNQEKALEYTRKDFIFLLTLISTKNKVLKQKLSDLNLA